MNIIWNGEQPEANGTPYIKGAVLSWSGEDDGLMERAVKSAVEANMNTLCLESSGCSSRVLEAARVAGLSIITAEIAESLGIKRTVIPPLMRCREHSEGNSRKAYLSQLKSALAALHANTEARASGQHGLLLPSLINGCDSSHSSLDCDGRWKLLHYAARSFFSPVAPMIALGKDKASIYFINDTDERIEAEFSLKIRDFGGGKKETREYSAAADPGSSVLVAEYPLSRVNRSKAFLYVKMATKDILRERSLLLESPERTEMQDPQIAFSARKTAPRSFMVRLKASHPAFLTALSSIHHGSFSDNLISVRPSAEKSVFFRSEEDISEEEFRSGLCVMDLWTAIKGNSGS